MEESTDCFKINRKLIPIKFHYFMFTAALGCVLPFRTIFARQLGISATEVGVIFCAVPFLRAAANPFFGFALDYFKKYRLTISVTIIVLAISHLLMIAVPPKTVDRNLDDKRNNFYTKVQYFCYNETFYDACDHHLLFYSKYKMVNPNERGSLVCDIECFDPKDGIIMDDVKSIERCSSKIKFALEISVNLHDCGMDIELEKCKLVVGDNSSISIPVNNSTIRQFTSITPLSANCSREIEFLAKIQGKGGLRNLSSNVLEAFENNKWYTSFVLPKNESKERDTYYSIYKYAFSAPMDILMNNSFCNLEYDCKTTKCFSNVHQKELAAKEKNFISLQFWSLFVLFALSSVTFCAITFMTDTVCHELLKDRIEQFGKQRTFGAIGWGIGSTLGGYLNQIISTEPENADYNFSFCVFAVILIIDLFPVYHFKVTDLKYSPHILKDVCFLFTKIDIVFNIIMLYFIGILNGFIFNYEFWFMQEIGSSQILLGLSQTFECIYEIPCFMLSGWVFKKIGFHNCNSITLLCFALRYLCFVFMYNPWWSLAAAAFHGPTHGLFYSSLTTFAKKKAPPGTEATVQSLMQLSFEGAGAATGSILGGICLDNFGVRNSFLYAGLLSFFMLGINVIWSIYQSYICRQKLKESPKELYTSTSEANIYI